MFCAYEMRNTSNIWSVNLKGRDHLRNVGIDMRIILKNRREGVECSNMTHDRAQTQALVNTVNEPSGATEVGQCLGQLSDHQFLKYDYAAWH
jgi:hypothetical protein